MSRINPQASWPSAAGVYLAAPTNHARFERFQVLIEMGQRGIFDPSGSSPQFVRPGQRRKCLLVALAQRISQASQGELQVGVRQRFFRSRHELVMFVLGKVGHEPHLFERLQRGKVGEHLKPICLALLGMKLRGEKVIAGNHRRERQVIGGLRRGHAGILRHHVIGVHKVDVRVLLQPGEQSTGLGELELVPAHVRHFELAGEVKADHFASNDAQTLVFASFVTLVKQELKSQADPQERFPRIYGIMDRLHEFAFAKFGHGILKGSNAWQHHLVSGGNLLRLVGNEYLGSDLLEPLLHAPQVSHPIVNDGNHISNARHPECWNF